MELVEYLLQRHTQGTTNRYVRDIKIYKKEVGETQAKTANYQDILDYVGKLRKQYQNAETVKCTLQGIKKYYNYLLHTGQRKDHPCRNLHLKDKRNNDIQIQDLFTEKELELLLKRNERYSYMKVKNEILISLLIYQGLTVGELISLELEHINLEEGTIYIKETTKTNARTLKLRSKQIMKIHNYINTERLEIADKYKTESNKLLLNHRGQAENGHGFKRLFEQHKEQFPNKILHAKTIRQSVIANLLKKGNDLRVVQSFAGHKYPSSTERYRQTGIKELQANVEKYHPLS